jgi:hypothetical protein
MKEVRARALFICVGILVGLFTMSRPTSPAVAAVPLASSPAEITIADWVILQAQMDFVVEAFSKSNRRLPQGINPPGYLYDAGGKRITAVVSVDAPLTTRAALAGLKQALASAGVTICLQPRVVSDVLRHGVRPNLLDGVSCVVEYYGPDSTHLATYDLEEKALSLR